MNLFLLADTFGENLREVAESPATTWSAILLMFLGMVGPKIKAWIDGFKPTVPGTVPTTTTTTPTVPPGTTPLPVVQPVPPGIRPTTMSVAEASKLAAAATEANNKQISYHESEIARLKLDNAVWGNVVVAQQTSTTVPGVVNP